MGNMRLSGEHGYKEFTKTSLQSQSILRGEVGSMWKVPLLARHAYPPEVMLQLSTQNRLLQEVLARGGGLSG